MRIDFVVSLDHTLMKVLTAFSLNYATHLTSLETNLVAFKDDILAKIAEAKQASLDEHTQVLAAIDALKAQLADVVSPDDQAAVFAAVDDLKASIGSVFTPDTP